jgi:hypothetical protein
LGGTCKGGRDAGTIRASRAGTQQQDDSSRLFPQAFASFECSAIDCARVRSFGGVRRPISKAVWQKSFAYQIAYLNPFLGVIWHHQTAHSSVGLVTNAAWNNEK